MQNNTNRKKTAKRIESLRSLFSVGSSLLIVLQNNPDPDSIAAAMALRYLANKFGGINCTLAHGGSIGRAENRAMVRYLGLNPRKLDSIEPQRYDHIAMVDTQPNTGNNALPVELVPDIVIDHHPCRHGTRSVRFIDVRSRYGACATILFEYIQEAGLEIEPPLATALVYAIRSDTQDLGREACKMDITAMQALYPIANLKMLSDIQRGRVERGYFKLLHKALGNAVACDKCIVSSLGEIDNADMIAEVADILLRDDKAIWTMCYGYYEDSILLSLRGEQDTKKASDIIKRIVSRMGTGGGHALMAGGQIDISKKNAQEIKKIEQTIKNRFFKSIGANSDKAVKLLD